MAKIFVLDVVHKAFNFKVFKDGEEFDQTYELWSFDDEAKGIKDEPFMQEASEAISKLLPTRARAASVYFSKKPFPGWQVKLTKDTATKGGGTWYMTTLGTKVWLCKVLKKYFFFKPKTIYALARVQW